MAVVVGAVVIPKLLQEFI